MDNEMLKVVVQEVVDDTKFVKQTMNQKMAVTVGAKKPSPHVIFESEIIRKDLLE